MHTDSKCVVRFPAPKTPPMTDDLKTTMYGVGETYLRGWYTLQELQAIIQAMDMLADKAQQAMRENLSDVEPRG